MKKLVCLSSLFLALALPAHAERYPLPSDTSPVIGQLTITTTHHDDTFLKLAKQFGVGYEEMILANPTVDPWLPGEGTQVVVPTQYILPDSEREGIVLNLAEMRLYYYPRSPEGTPQYVHTYPISIGRQGWDTPVGLTRIIRKKKDPTWYPPESIREEYKRKGKPLESTVPPGPDNPLGKFALYMALPSYVIHGTNEPRGIGMRVTHGCIRLRPDDIKDLFYRISPDTPVTIVNQPYKVAWHRDRLYAEMHPGTEEGSKPGSNLTQLVRTITGAADTGNGYRVDWGLAMRLAKGKTGLPTVVGFMQPQ